MLQFDQRPDLETIFCENNSGLSCALTEALERRCDDEIVSLYGQSMMRMMFECREHEFLWEVLLATLLYQKLSELADDLPEVFRRIQPIMLKRLYLEGLFRQKFMCAEFLLKQLPSLTKTLAIDEREEFQDAVAEMLLAMVELVSDHPGRKKRYKIVELCKQQLQLLVSNGFNPCKTYLVRQWNNLQMGGLEHPESYRGVNIKPSKNALA